MGRFGHFWSLEVETKISSIFPVSQTRSTLELWSTGPWRVTWKAKRNFNRNGKVATSATLLSPPSCCREILVVCAPPMSPLRCRPSDVVTPNRNCCSIGFMFPIDFKDGVMWNESHALSFRYASLKAVHFTFNYILWECPLISRGTMEKQGFL